MVSGLDHSDTIPTAWVIRYLSSSIWVQLIVTLRAYTLEVVYVQHALRALVYRLHMMHCICSH
jgi:hypothetical protein